MRVSALSSLAFTVAALAALEGCAPSLAQPFDSLKSAPVTIYRLQNFEPPAQAQAQPAAGGAFQLPAEIQQWVTAGAALLPAGLLPPGLIPGSAPPPPPTAQDLRFHGFRVLGWQAVTTPALHDEIVDILGHDGNFVAQHDNCMYAEFGFAFQPAPGAPTDDVLVSLSCDQAQGFNFAWPYAKSGLPAETAKRIVVVAQKSFGGT
jgi:hypothetical protein